MMRVGIAADHGGFELKGKLVEALASQYEVIDFGAHRLTLEDDYPDIVVSLGRAVARREVERGVAICGSGVGASVAVNKIPGVRAALIADVYSAHQGVEDDDMNVICLGGRVMGYALALDLVQTFLKAQFRGEERFLRRLKKVSALERNPGRKKSF
jgi:ribose 5-phosphate isomerase B